MHHASAQYANARPLIEAAARNQSLLPYDEAVAVGNLTYVRCQRRHRTGRGRFANHLRFKLKRDIIEAARDDARKRHGLKPDRSTPVLHPLPLFDVHPGGGHWSDALSEEAWSVVRLALSHADEWRPATLRKRVKRYLTDLGWSVKEIARTFNEISEVLP